MQYQYFYLIVFLLILIILVGMGYVSVLKKTNIKLLKQVSQHKLTYDDLKKELTTQTTQVSEQQTALTQKSEQLDKLHAEIELLSLVASNTDNGIIITNSDGDFVWVNQGFETLTGFNLEGLKSEIGTNIFEASSKKDLKEFIDSCIEKNERISYISKFTTRSGRKIWLKTLINPILNKHSNETQYIIVETDVSELKNLNEELKKLSMVTHKTDNSILIYDSECNLYFVNEGFTNLYGYTKDEFIKLFGETFKDFCKLNDSMSLKEELISSQHSVSFIKDFETKDGQQKWKQTNIVPSIDDMGQINNFIVIETDITEIKLAEQKLQEEKQKSEELLLNILPEETAEELKSKGYATPRLYRSASVLFADLVGFTKKAEQLNPKELVHVLQAYFTRFDDATNKFFVEKIKVIGDAFLCVGGVPMKNKSHPFDTILLGLELQKIMQEVAKEDLGVDTSDWSLRVGIHTGPLVAGVVGKKKITYDIWGDSVNVAKRLESSCVPGMVNISFDTYRFVKDYFDCEARGKISVKNRGDIDMYFVKRIKPEYSNDEYGFEPNKEFVKKLTQL